MESVLLHEKYLEMVLEFLSGKNEEIKIGIAYNQFRKAKGLIFSFKTFQRLISELAEREIIIVEKVIGGAYGSTTLIKKVGA